MPTQKAQAIIRDYEFHNMLIRRFVDGISHEESVLQLPFEHNCLNWILGHIVTNRSHVLETVGAEHAWQDETDPLGSNAIEVQLSRLRAKIEPDPHNPRYIVTVRGRGYKLVNP